MSQSMQKALKTAYEAEKEGLRSYLKFAKETTVASGKNMFLQLALDEIDHMDMIEKYMDNLLAGKKFEPVKVPKARISEFMPKVSDASRTKTEKSTVSDETALKIALAHEEKACSFYKEEAEKTEDAELKAFFLKLSEVEMKHRDIIQAELDFMAQDGFWFDAMEFSLEK